MDTRGGMDEYTCKYMSENIEKANLLDPQHDD